MLVLGVDMTSPLNHLPVSSPTALCFEKQDARLAKARKPTPDSNVEVIGMKAVGMCFFRHVADLFDAPRMVGFKMTVSTPSEIDVAQTVLFERFIDRNRDQGLLVNFGDFQKVFQRFFNIFDRTEINGFGRLKSFINIPGFLATIEP